MLITHNVEPIKGLKGKSYQTVTISILKFYTNERMRKS